MFGRLRQWRERDHPRHEDGRFRDKEGPGWADAVAERLVPTARADAAPDLIADGRGGDLAQAALDAARAYPGDEYSGDLAGRLLHRGGGVGPHGDEALYHIAVTQGFDALPETLTAVEMDERIRQGATELFRGIEHTRDGRLSAGEMHRQVREGPVFYGLGFAGNGIYAGNVRSTAAEYGFTGRYALRPDARVVDFRELQEEQEQYLASVGRDTVLGRVYADAGRYAAARGYDAIRWRRGDESGQPGKHEYIVLNRGTLLADAEGVTLS